ncbi:hypothetical protein [Sphingomonas sp. PAMC 26605]|uniref:hypothetical protein n=1 Tax=Sphingomonas sp. PAMC 26605 TaxID=1112214 RepID=UPI00030B0A34|nr:hypothetical protein [Sphingomonas sp. PAMC 26605]
MVDLASDLGHIHFNQLAVSFLHLACDENGIDVASIGSMYDRSDRVVRRGQIDV